MRRVAPAIGIVLLFWCLSGIGHARAQSAAPTLSPEEGIVRLLPYRLTAFDLPSGYTTETPVALAPSVRAFQSASTAGSDPHDWLTRLDGTVVTMRQRMSAALVFQQVGTIDSYLTVDATAARRLASAIFIASKNETSESVISTVSLGESLSVWHVTRTPTGDPASGRFLFLWKRGLVVFSLTTVAPLGQELFSAAMALAAAVDNKAATAQDPIVAPPSVASPVTEDQRVTALQQLSVFDVRAEDALPGFRLLTHYQDHPANYVLRAADPVAALKRIDDSVKRIITVGESYGPVAGTTVLGINVEVRMDADALGAAAELTPPLDAPLGTTLRSIAPPIILGDATSAFQATSVASDGSPTEEVSLAWTHGALLLSVSLRAAPGSLSMLTLVAFAQQLEALYKQSLFASAPQGRASTSLN